MILDKFHIDYIQKLYIDQDQKIRAASMNLSKFGFKELPVFFRVWKRQFSPSAQLLHHNGLFLE